MKLEASAEVARSGWQVLLRRSAGTLGVALAATGLLLRDKEALAIAGVVGVGLVLLWVQRPKLGTIVLGLSSLNIAAWMIPGAISNLRHGDGPVATILPAVIAVCGLTVAAAALQALVYRDGPRGHRAGAGWVVAGAVVTVAVVGAAAFATRDGLNGGRADVTVETKDMAFAETTMEAEAGRISIQVRNGDLFWHTFTVPDLDVDVRVPVKAKRSVVVDAGPGTYEFVCAIPGHAQVGMKGTLTVR